MGVILDKQKMAEGRIRAAKQWEAEKADFIAKNPDNISTYFRLLPDTCKKLWHRCFMGKSSNAEAIKAKCLDCCAYDRDEVKNCTVKTCPLWSKRPYAQKGQI